MKAIKIIFIAGQIFFLFYLNYYVLHLKFRSPQTGLDVLFCGVMFLLFGICVLVVPKLWPSVIGKRDKLILVIFALSTLISLNFFLFDYFNILVEYDRWLKKGMPEKPFWF